MTPMQLRGAIRKYASHLSREQRRKWMIQRLQLTPKVNISGSYLPPSVARQYVQIEWLRGGAA